MTESIDKIWIGKMGMVLYISIHQISPLPGFSSSGGMNGSVASVLHPLYKNFTVWLWNMLSLYNFFGNFWETNSDKL